MKRILSLMLTVVLIATLLCSAFMVDAAAITSFETDFSQYTQVKTFKQACDADGNWIENGYTFSKTDDGLRYFRDADEVFYNPNKQVKPPFTVTNPLVYAQPVTLRTLLKLPPIPAIRLSFLITALP